LHATARSAGSCTVPDRLVCRRPPVRLCVLRSMDLHRDHRRGWRENDLSCTRPGKPFLEPNAFQCGFCTSGLSAVKPCSRSSLHRPTTRSGSGDSRTSAAARVPDDTGRHAARGKAHRHSRMKAIPKPKSVAPSGSNGPRQKVLGAVVHDGIILPGRVQAKILRSRCRIARIKSIDATSCEVASRRVGPSDGAPISQTMPDPFYACGIRRQPCDRHRQGQIMSAIWCRRCCSSGRSDAFRALELSTFEMPSLPALRRLPMHVGRGSPPSSKKRKAVFRRCRYRVGAWRAGGRRNRPRNVLYEVRYCSR